MFGPWIEMYMWLRTLLPSFDRTSGLKGIKSFKGLRLPRLSFILIHYIYLIGLTIIGALILYAGSNLDFIDALFFGSGCATQSGLNTININQLHLFQQISIFLVTMFATPIFINTVVVFVRLYWFEKRFQNVVLEAQRYRRTRERTRTMTDAKDEPDIVSAEKGVGNRKIVVMHPGNRTMSIANHHRRSIVEHKSAEDSSESSGGQEADEQESSSTGYAREPESDEVDEEQERDGAKPDSDEDQDTVESAAPFHRNIMFADEVNSPTSPTSPKSIHDSRLPIPRTAEHHIAFLEKQRNREDTGTLYIPGPRDFDKGYRPQEVDESDGDFTRVQSNVESPAMTRAASLPSPDMDESENINNEASLKQRVTDKLSFEDAAFPITKARKGPFSRLKPSTKSMDGANDEDDEDNVGEPPAGLHKRGRSRTFATIRNALTEDDDNVINPMPYLSYQPTIGRNSAFVNLTEQQREELGGIEYRALKTLAVVLCTYYVGFHLLGVVCLTPWIQESSTWGPIVQRDSISRVWWGFFTSASLFNDLGYTLTPDSMISFKYAVFPLLLGSWLIIIGNTGFPCWLRLMIWGGSKVVPKNSSLWEEFRFLLDHPRRCFTLLFPSKATWWLFWILVILNVVDLILFIVLDLTDPVIDQLPAGFRVLNGWFQAASTRTAGFQIVNLSLLHPACQVSYMIMMYISVFPIAISVRRTNVYEEKSLGIWGGPVEEDDDNPNQSYVSTHLRRQLSFDLWYIFLGLFIICIAEGDKLQNTNEYAFTIFSVLFEIVSAYGTVGLSLGYPGSDASFSGQFNVISKLVIIAMQIRGRHRGLPYALDKAILLPSEEQQRKESTQLRRQRTETGTTLDGDAAADHPTLRRTGTERSTRSTQSNRKGGWKRLIGSALSAGPAGKLD